MVHQCPECEITTVTKSQLLQHQRVANHWRSFRCDTCGALFTRQVNLDRHKERHNNTNNVHCPICGRSFTRPDSLRLHLAERHQIGGGQKQHVSPDDNGPVRKLKKDDDPRQYYTINKVRQQRIEKFKTISSVYKVVFNQSDLRKSSQSESSLLVLLLSNLML